MSKTKKIFTAIALAVLMMFTSFLFVACNNKATSKDSYLLIKDTLASYKENTKLFEAGKVESISTNFLFKNFKTKDEEGNLVEDDNNYLIFTAFGLNFIEKNYEKLENLDVKYNFAELKKNIKNMNEKYNVVCQEFAKLTSIDNDADYQIYNGIFGRYKQSVKYFINDVYLVASQLGSILVEINGDGIGNADMTNEVFNSYLEYNKFLITQDMKNFFMDSAQGKIFDEDLYKDVQSLLKLYCTSLANNTEISLSTEDATAVKELLEAVNTDRKNVRKSLEKFSLYDFYSTYDASVTAFEKVVEDAGIYYNNIDNYFNFTGILNKLQAYLLMLYV